MPLTKKPAQHGPAVCVLLISERAGQARVSPQRRVRALPDGTDECALSPSCPRRLSDRHQRRKLAVASSSFRSASTQAYASASVLKPRIVWRVPLSVTTSTL